MIPSQPTTVPKVPPKLSKPSPTSSLCSPSAAAASQPTEILAVLEIGESGMIVAANQPVSPTSARPPRLERETDDAYQRFLAYALAPTRNEARSFSAVARACGVDESSIRSQAARFDWRQRCIAWDKRRTEAASMRAGELQAATAISHASVAEELVRQNHEALLITAELLAGEIDLEVIETWQRLTSGISKSLEKAQKVARLALGQSDSNIAVKTEVKKEPELDFGKLSDAELQLVSLFEMFRLARSEGPKTPLPDEVRAVLRFLEGR